MHIRLIENVVSEKFGILAAGLILHFPDKEAVQLLNAGAAAAVRTTEFEIATEITPTA